MNSDNSDQSSNLAANSTQPSSPRTCPTSLTPLQPHFEIFDEPLTPDEFSSELDYLVSKLSRKIQDDITDQTLEIMKGALCKVTLKSIPLFSDVEVAQIKKCKSVPELTGTCRDHWKLNGYAMLKLIAKSSGSQAAILELQRFQRKVLAKNKLKDLGTKWLVSTNEYPKYFERMKVIISQDYDDISVKHFEEVESFISEISDPPMVSIQVKCYSNCLLFAINYCIAYTYIRVQHTYLYYKQLSTVSRYSRAYNYIDNLDFRPIRVYVI